MSDAANYGLCGPRRGKIRTRDLTASIDSSAPSAGFANLVAACIALKSKSLG
jgi:hypothetical protein